MIVTITTDASFSWKHKRASYAFWITSNMGRIQKAGLLKRTITRPEVAELMCIINAIHTLGKEGYSSIRKIIINTDCLNVIHYLENDVRAISKYNLSFFKGWSKKYSAKLSEFRFEGLVEFRHIKAHIGTDTPRTWVNEWCDKSAKEVMGEFLKKQ